MKEYHDSNPNYIALHTNKQRAYSAKVGALSPVFEKSAAEPKLNLDAKTLLTKQFLMFEISAQ